MATYGTITHGAEGWRIECEPFVTTRLKRVFARVKQHAADYIVLSATPENSRELLWFLQRYPMECSASDLSRLSGLARQHEDSELRLADLMAGHIAPTEVRLAEPPRAYQAFAAEMLEIRGGYLLADDLGLGKTVTAICGMVRAGNLPVLVVCPAHLPRQWAKMVRRFAPDLQVHILKKGTPYDLMPRQRAAQAGLFPPSLPNVIITSYHKLRGWAETLAGVVQYVVFDECQALRSPGTAIYAAANMVARKARRRLGLSSTPIYNYGHEFHHVLDVLCPDALGTYHEFIREWCTSLDGHARLKDAKEFGSYLRREGLMLRRTRADVGRELPELTKVVHEVDADQAALDAIKGNAVELAKILLRQGEQFKGQRMQAAGEFDMIMRQATGIAKSPYVIEFVKLLLESDEPVVLWGWHRACYDLWLEGLAEHKPAMFTGSESPKQKDESIQRFLSGETKLLIMSLRSGAGVDGLQGYCHTGVVGELDWSPGVLEQCMGRLHRDGQADPCTLYFLVSDSGTDPIMSEVLGLKREQLEGVRNPDTALAERIDTGENSLRRLARDLLIRRGVALPSPEVSADVLSMKVIAGLVQSVPNGLLSGRL